MKNPEKSELVRQVEAVMRASACVVDLDSMLNRLEALFPGKDVGTWIFNPPTGKRMTAEEIVDALLDGRDVSFRVEE